MAECDEFDETLRLCRTDESDDESCKELSGEAEKAAPFAVRVVSEGALIDLAGIGDWYGDVARVSPPNSCPGESCGIAEVKNSRPPSSMVPAISESKMRGESKLGSGNDDGKGSSVEAMAIVTRSRSSSSRFTAFKGREEPSAYRFGRRSRGTLGCDVVARSTVWHFGTGTTGPTSVGLTLSAIHRNGCRSSSRTS